MARASSLSNILDGAIRAVDSNRSGFLPYGPLVSEWLAFLAERLTAEFLRDVEPKP
jgi:hypothetical protein